MSRSFRRIKIFANCARRKQKMFKKNEHQRERTITRISLKKAKDYDNMVLPTPKDFGNEWASPRDGKHYWSDASKKDMRK